MAKGKYNPDTFPLLVEDMARQGATDIEIARALGIGLTSFYAYARRHAPFAEALKRGKRPVDVKVENDLLKRACGYFYDEVTREVRQVAFEEDGTPVMGMVVTKRVTKHVVPDVTAQIFWLKNRRPDRWRDKRDVEVSGTTEIILPEELADLD